MSCNCCCSKTLRLCSVPVCGEIDFGITAQVAGVHKMEVQFLSVKKVIQKSFGIDEQIVFPLSDLNENFVFVARLYDPNGTQMLIEKDGIEYDCYEFETVLSETLSTVTEES